MTTLPLSWRVQHTSGTPGTGTLTLNAAAANRRSLFDASAGGRRRATLSIDPRTATTGVG